MAKSRTVISIIGTVLDAGQAGRRWERWRPNVSLCQHDDLMVDRLELLHDRQFTNLAKQVAEDIAQVSPETVVCRHTVGQRDPWDFEEVYTSLHDFAAGYEFRPDVEYLVHITTGTHVAQICLFLLTESRRFPAKLIQTSPKRGERTALGEYRIIDLDLSKYEKIAARFQREFTDNVTGLKSGIATRNPAFNRLIEELEQVAAHSVDPILLMGPTGAGKSQLARRIFELKKHRRQVEGAFVEVNCATLRGDAAMSTLFGHKKGAFTGAASDRAGLLRSAHKGVLFLDEIGELGLDEQAMLLRALEEKRFFPLGADEEVGSEFQLIGGTNRDLAARVRAGEFREDLLARINLWTFRLPALRERREDIEPNLEYELTQFAARTGRTVRFATEARDTFIEFATGPRGAWAGNFRDLSASVTRMATLGTGGRIGEQVVAGEIARLEAAWSGGGGEAEDDVCVEVMGAARAAELDLFDRVQLEEVLKVCRRVRSMSEAGRELFAKSREKKKSSNDADRIRKYLARFGVAWEEIGSG